MIIVHKVWIICVLCTIQINGLIYVISLLFLTKLCNVKYDRKLEEELKLKSLKNDSIMCTGVMYIKL